jgi:hypothetical protein
MGHYTVQSVMFKLAKIGSIVNHVVDEMHQILGGIFYARFDRKF